MHSFRKHTHTENPIVRALHELYGGDPDREDRRVDPITTGVCLHESLPVAAHIEKLINQKESH